MSEMTPRRRTWRTVDPDQRDMIAAASVLRQRAEVLERAAARNAAVGKINGEQAKLERAAGLRETAALLDALSRLPFLRGPVIEQIKSLPHARKEAIHV